MKKICYVSTLPITIRSFFIPQLQYLAERGFDVTVICSGDSFLQKELGDKVKYHPIHIPRGINLIASIKAIHELEKYFKAEAFDLVQYSTPNASLYASIAAKSVGIKLRNYHLMGYRYLGSKGILRILLKFFEKTTCRNSTSIECVSESNLKLGLKENLFEQNKVTVIWNGSSGGVDLKRFDFSKRTIWRDEKRRELGLESDDFVYGFCGRITRDKGINELLEAFLQLNNNCKLLLLGSVENDDNGLNMDLWNCAMDCPNVIFHTSVQDIEKYYAAIDVLVLPSYREGFGNVIIEAAAMGTPAIVSNIPGPIDAVIKGHTAYVVNPKDTTDLMEKMIMIKDENINMMSLNAYKYIKESFDSAMLCKEILNRKINLLHSAD